MDASLKRATVTASHLSDGSGQKAPIKDIKAAPKAAWNIPAMTHVLEHDHHEYKQKLRDIIAKEPVFRMDDLDMNMAQARERTFNQVKKILESKVVSVMHYRSDPGKFLSFLENISLNDTAMGVKCGVHMVLFGGAIMHLGTKKHHEKYAPLIDTLQLPGCFGMTELGHGSNVQGIETEAIYDKQTGEFIINTPNDAAQKFWIGGAAMHAQACTVFANLILDGVNHGVHVFIVPIRKPDGTIEPNVRIKDNGHKMGLLGVDNGRIWFDKKRIPRDNLLNKFGDVTPEGKYVSTYDNSLKRFGAMVAPLVGGRVLISCGALNASKICLYIAVKYGFQRKQFGKPGQETPIMNYLTHQRRLYPAIAGVYVYQNAVNFLKEKFCKPDQTPSEKKEIHLLAAALKPMTTWHRTETAQFARECCGGMGFGSKNRIGGIKADYDVDLTYEGDNTVLLQQVARDLLVEFQKGKVNVEPAVGEMGTTQLRSSTFLLGALKWRETNILSELANRITEDVGAGMKQMAAFYKHLDLVSALAKAWAERVALERTYMAMNTLPADLKVAMERMAALFGLYRIERDLGWFTTYGGISTEQADAVLKLVNTLCREVHDYADAYVDSFGYPEWVIRAPIAYDYLSYFAYAHPDDHVSKQN